QSMTRSPESGRPLCGTFGNMPRIIGDSRQLARQEQAPRPASPGLFTQLSVQPDCSGKVPFTSATSTNQPPSGAHTTLMGASPHEPPLTTHSSNPLGRNRIGVGVGGGGVGVG